MFYHRKMIFNYYLNNINSSNYHHAIANININIVIAL